MKCILLCAGYATRLFPITKNFPKALLEIEDGKPLLNYIMDQIDNISDIDEIQLITNDRYYNHFINWKDTLNTNKKLAKCIDCGTPIFISKRASTKNCKCKVCKNKHTCTICGKEYVYIKGQNTVKFCSKECQQEYHNNKKKLLYLLSLYVSLALTI